MKAFINDSGFLYFGDRYKDSHVVATESQIASFYLGLFPPKTPAEIAAIASDGAKRELAALDLASIRAMREWIVLQPTAPQSLKDRDAAALLARGRIT